MSQRTAKKYLWSLDDFEKHPTYQFILEDVIDTCLEDYRKNPILSAYNLKRIVSRTWAGPVETDKIGSLQLMLWVTSYYHLENIEILLKNPNARVKHPMEDGALRHLTEVGKMLVPHLKELRNQDDSLDPQTLVYVTKKYFGQATVVKIEKMRSYICENRQELIEVALKNQESPKELQNLNEETKEESSSRGCDVLIAVGNKKILADKRVLARHSQVFEAIFSNPMIENEKNMLEIVDIDIEVFEQFLNYLYRGKVELLEYFVAEMIIVADKYQVTELKKLCEDYMLQNLDSDNVVQYLFIADKLCCAKLKKKTLHSVKNSPKVLAEVIKKGDPEVLMGLKEIFAEDS